jgi:6-phospho-beta-glucosidase
LACLNINAVCNWLYLDASVWGTYNPIALDFIKKKGFSLEINVGDMEIMNAGKPDFIVFNYYSSNTVDAYQKKVENGRGDQQIAISEECF